LLVYSEWENKSSFRASWSTSSNKIGGEETGLGQAKAKGKEPDRVNVLHMKINKNPGHLLIFLQCLITAGRRETIKTGLVLCNGSLPKKPDFSKISEEPVVWVEN